MASFLAMKRGTPQESSAPMRSIEGILARQEIRRRAGYEPRAFPASTSASSSATRGTRTTGGSLARRVLFGPGEDEEAEKRRRTLLG